MAVFHTHLLWLRGRAGGGGEFKPGHVPDVGRLTLCGNQDSRKLMQRNGLLERRGVGGDERELDSQGIS